MKNYVYVILLLMCGLAHFTTQVRGYCHWGGQMLELGSHTIYPCRRLECKENDIIKIVGCPRLTCPPDSTLYVTPRDDKKEFPDCCQKPLCVRRSSPIFPEDKK
ncbi:uncharacterized protein LOC105199526 [Solenopsis invicta]|uniref:uncharacterized protein LOC105199526 n=1 Tax=Solenopsis invicta TaxID=13686 RepID=UPI0001FEA50D|nr:uncharacterized protein LOC105199526 [Solenopsis invicta]